MIDEQADLLELERLLAEANPVRVEELADHRSAAAAALYARTLSQLRPGRAATHFRPRVRRRALVLALALVLLLVAAGAIAAVTIAPWWEEGERAVNPEVVDRQLAPSDAAFPPTADRARARTVARAEGAALVAAPVGESGYCLIPSLPGSPDLGFSCTYQLSDEFRSYARPSSAGAPRWILYGRITDARARALDLSEAAGVPLTVRLQPGGFFLANVPESLWRALGNSAGRGRIVDEEGRTLRSGCVNWGPSPHQAGAGESRFSFWREGDLPCRAQPVPEPPTPLLDQAQKLVQITLREKHGIWEAGTSVALWRAPTRQGGECIYLAQATPRGGAVPGVRGLPGSGSCTVAGRQPPPTRPLTVSLSLSRLGSERFSVVVEGQVKAVDEVARVALRTPRRETEVAYRNGFFLAQLPSSATPDELPPGGPYTIVAYDAAGRELATEKLQTMAERFGSAGG